MATTHETLTHPILGRLVWEAKYGPHWCGQCTQPGGLVDLFIKPADPVRRHQLKRAADLCLWAQANESRIKRQAVEAQLYNLYQSYPPEDFANFTAEELEAALEWELLVISDSEIVPVCFGYHDAGWDLFGGRVVRVELDAGLNYHRAHLRFLG